MRKSLCVWLTTILPAIMFGITSPTQTTAMTLSRSATHAGIVRSNSKYSEYTLEEIDNAWIRVPWSHGGHYYHNTITRHDQDNHPDCLSNQCHWNWN